jgi:hypothetical protein
VIISCEFCITNNIGKDYGGEFAGLFSHYAVNLPIIPQTKNPANWQGLIETDAFH